MTLLEILRDPLNEWTVQVAGITYDRSKLDGEEIVLGYTADRYSPSGEMNFRINAIDFSISPSIIKYAPSSYQLPRHVFNGDVKIIIQHKDNREHVEIINLLFHFKEKTNSLEFIEWKETTFIREYNSDTYIVLFTPSDHKISITGLKAHVLETHGSYESARKLFDSIEKIIDHSALC